MKKFIEASQVARETSGIKYFRRQILKFELSPKGRKN